jgi:hypothetical protein
VLSTSAAAERDERRTMASLASSRLLDISGDGSLDRLVEPLCRALGGRRRFYSVRVESLGGVGEVLVAITGSRGHLPLILSPQDLEPGDVFRVVSDVLDRFGL